ncbi:class I adenylate-forming enzyme family protein [Nocardioides sp. cx-173]|uniref:class I adenylate-forming enzyme family protein n=1 Tax=Nocardioides sp. cx-173 TaxID=2898796 RepID=UPI001E32D752|nr:class I adenylate-forming enzyme family protein [Nocardioides sp. cx-173]MCD4524236.1 acyl--CoA ligase [Nocardioides sp. cx-173]UGB41628.1 acyl--CoA ligase [Nocardioides sp. cx-173]
MNVRTARSAQAQRASSLLQARLEQVLGLDPQAIAMTYKQTTFQWSFYADAIADLNALVAEHPEVLRIGIVLRNRPGPVAALIATVGTGREVVTLSPHLGDVGLAQDILDLAPDVVIAEDEDWAREPMRDAARSVLAIALRSGVDRALSPHPADWVAAPSPLPPSDTAVLMMTSGTTGRPKRVDLTYDRVVAAFQAGGLKLDADHSPRQLREGHAILWASLVHISGLYFALSNALEARPIAVLEKFDVGAWVALVNEHQPRFVRLAPTAIRMVLEANVPTEVFSGMRAIGSGSAPLPVELVDEFEQRYGVPVLGTYGATEFAGAIAGWTLKDKKAWGEHKRGSVGRAYHDIELRVVDRDTGEVLPAGEAGILEARGGQLPTVNGNWLRTTDLAVLDDDGFLFIRGRADDAINRGGFKVPPSVIEDALREHPAVAEAAALGLPHLRLGQVPVVAVTLVAPATEDELMEYLAERLTSYQRPVSLRVVDELPLTPSLKVSRPLVRELYFSDAHDDVDVVPTGARS